MTEKIFFTAYRYDELSSKAQEKAIEKLYDINVDNEFWDECTLDYWKEKLEAMGFIGAKVHYTGFWSQGDGACFTARGLDVFTFLKEKKALTEYRHLIKHLKDETAEIVLRIKHYGRYYHEVSTSVEEEIYYYGENRKVEERIYEQADQLVRWIKQERADIGREIYDELEKEYSYLTSREVVEETIRANEYLFHEDGVLISYQYKAKYLNEVLEEVAI